MTYEEKLDKIVQKLKYERDLTRKGHTSQLSFTDESFTKLSIREVCQIILQLQDDEKVVKITAAIQPMETVSTEEIINPSSDFKPEYIEEVTIEFGEDFDRWYGIYLLKQRSQLANLDWINLLKVLDVCQDIDQQLQMRNHNMVLIPSFPYPYIGRFRELFPYDTVGTRKAYQESRWDGAQYLHKQGIALRVEHTDGMVDYGRIKIFVNLNKFPEFFNKVKDEFTKRKEKFVEENSQTSVEPTVEQKIEDDIAWADDFIWEGNNFVFGNFGKINIVSNDRKHIMKVLTEKKGGWATISELKGKKDANYVRSTIKQLEDRLPDEVKKHISIIPTLGQDDITKPNAGAYRIKVIL